MLTRPRRLEFEDGFSGEDGEPDDDMPSTKTGVTLEALRPGATRMTLVSTFPSIEAMEQLVEMGVEEGISGAWARSMGCS